jgi:hypothetical protein
MSFGQGNLVDKGSMDFVVTYGSLTFALDRPISRSSTDQRAVNLVRHWRPVEPSPRGSLQSTLRSDHASRSLDNDLLVLTPDVARQMRAYADQVAHIRHMG